MLFHLGLGDLLPLVLKCGEINLRAMELLDAGNTGRYGHPVPTPVPLGHKKGKAILVSGHDLLDLEEILKKKSDATKRILAVHGDDPVGMAEEISAATGFKVVPPEQVK